MKSKISLVRRIFGIPLTVIGVFTILLSMKLDNLTVFLITIISGGIILLIGLSLLEENNKYII